MIVKLVPYDSLTTATSSICTVSVKYMYLWMSLISTCV